MKKQVCCLFAGALMGLCACNTFHPKGAPEGDLLRISAADTVPVLKRYSVRQGMIPIPLDQTLLYLKRNLPAGARPDIVFPDDPSIVTEYNRYAAEKIFSGATFDIRKERESFLREKAGMASGILLEYFRRLERRTLNVYSHTRLRHNNEPSFRELYHTNMLSDFAPILEHGLKSDLTDGREILRKELEFFRSREKQIASDLLMQTLKLRAGDGKWQRMQFLSGNPAKLQTLVKADLAPDQTGLILRVKCDEPKMTHRKVVGTQRDYANAPGEDCIELFVSPDIADPARCYQFVITSAGAFWDAEHKLLSGISYTEWNSTGTCKVVRKENFWEVTLYIPWKDFSLDNMPEKPFLVNFYRSRMVHGEKLQSYAWNPVQRGGYFQPDKFGYLIWKD